MKTLVRAWCLSSVLFATALAIAYVAPAGLAADNGDSAPTVTTDPSPGVVIGGPVLNAATISNGTDPTGEITFKLYGPDDSDCSDAPEFTDAKTVAGNESYTSVAFTPAEAGTYNWTVSYSGDANNDAVEGSCAAPEESVAVLASAPPAPATVHTNSTVMPGINASPVGAYTGYLNQLDARVGRTWTRWCQIQSVAGSSSSYNFSGPFGINAIRNTIKSAETDGIRPLLVLQTKAPVNARTNAMQVSGTTGCADAPVHTEDEASIRASSTDEFADAARHLVYCLKGDQTNCPGANTNDNLILGGSWGPGMYGIEIGNEPNSSRFWQDGTDDITTTQAAIYTDALSQAADEIHSISNIPVSSAGLAYGSSNNNYWGEPSVDADTYLTEILPEAPAIDAIAIHPYGPLLHPDFGLTGCSGPCENNVLNALYNARVLADYSFYSDTPLWITEVGVDADYDNPQQTGYNDVTSAEETQHATDLTRIWNTIRYSCSYADVELAVFWTIADDKPYRFTTPVPDYYAGFLKINPLTDAVDTSKAAYQSFKNNGTLDIANRSCLG